jgi:hypothetical protein
MAYYPSCFSIREFLLAGTLKPLKYFNKYYFPYIRYGFIFGLMETD